MKQREKWLATSIVLATFAAYAGAEKFIYLRPDGAFRTSAIALERFEKHGAKFGSTTLSEYLHRIATFGKLALEGHFPLKIGDRPGRAGSYQIFERSTGVYAVFAQREGFTLTAFRADPAAHGYPTNDLFWESIRGLVPRNWPSQPNEAVVARWRELFLGQDGSKVETALTVQQATATVPDGRLVTAAAPGVQPNNGAVPEFCIDCDQLERILEWVGVYPFMGRVHVHRKVLNSWLQGQPVERQYWKILRREFPEIERRK